MAVEQRHEQYPTAIGWDGKLRYIGPGGYQYPTIEKLEKVDAFHPERFANTH